jgi:hypothetical protein
MVKKQGMDLGGGWIHIYIGIVLIIREAHGVSEMYLCDFLTRKSVF